MNEILTEDDIKKATLGFLKTYYRYRPRAGETELSSDMRGAGGIIADGFLSFKKDDGTIFTATLEATSYDTRYEVLFKLRKQLLRWDALATSLAINAFFAGYFYIAKEELVADLAGILQVCLILFSSFFTWYLYVVTFKKSRRYRYIYAIEQFKQYHADEQWVSIGEDVFLDHKDPFYLELRDQCIYNGFGLIQIDFKKRAQMLMSPSRKEVSTKKRRIIPFISAKDLNRSMDWLRQFNKRRRNWMPGTGDDFFLPLNRKYFHQMIVSGFSIFLILTLLIRELSKSPVKYVNEKTYPQKVLKKIENSRPEPIAYLLDTSSVRPFLEQVSPYLDIRPGERPVAGKSNNIQNPEAIVFSEEDSLIYYDCSRFYTPYSKYLVAMGEYPDLELALVRMWEINQSTDLEVNSVWLKCFWEETTGYVLYLGPMYDTYNEASARITEIKEQVMKEIPEVRLSVKALPPGDLQRDE